MTHHLLNWLSLLLRFRTKRERIQKMSTECAGCTILKFYMAKDSFTQSVLCVMTFRVFEFDFEHLNVFENSKKVQQYSLHSRRWPASQSTGNRTNNGPSTTTARGKWMIISIINSLMIVQINPPRRNSNNPLFKKYLILTDLHALLLMSRNGKLGFYVRKITDSESVWLSNFKYRKPFLPPIVKVSSIYMR